MMNKPQLQKNSQYLWACALFITIQIGVFETTLKHYHIQNLIHTLGTHFNYNTKAITR